VIASHATRRRRALRGGMARARADDGFEALLALPLETPRGEGSGLVLVFFGGAAAVHRRRPRARTPPRGRGTRRARAQRALRGRARRASSRAAARAERAAGSRPSSTRLRCSTRSSSARRPARCRRVRDPRGRGRRAGHLRGGRRGDRGARRRRSP
jgi:hypothetical protein